MLLSAVKFGCDKKHTYQIFFCVHVHYFSHHLQATVIVPTPFVKTAKSTKIRSKLA